LDHLECCDALHEEIALFAAMLDGPEMHTSVPTCPGWSIGDLARHLGVVHRWVEQMVRELAPRRLEPPSGPADMASVDSQWLLSGGAALLETLRRTNPDLAMWAWGSDQHVCFWSRRQVHETLVHRIDLQLALDLRPTANAVVAADAIGECLVNLAPAASFSPRIAELRGSPGRFRLRDSATGSEWIVSSDPFDQGHWSDDPPVDAELTAEGLDLLTVLYRRCSIDDIDGDTQGDTKLLRTWLDHLQLE
jgi:uncharacterized protein (TIGR03083 family)